MHAAEAILRNTQFVHPGVLDGDTRCYTCCQRSADAPGCEERSLRRPGDLARAEVSLQYALNHLVSLQKSGL